VNLIVVLALLVGASLLGGPSVGSGSHGGGAVTPSSFLSALYSMMGWLYALGAGLPGKESSPPYTDCGEFIRKGLASQGISVGRTITSQVGAAPYTKSVKGVSRSSLLSQLRVGDCIAFKWNSGGFQGRPYDHGGVYVGNGKMIHASSSAGKVIEANVPSSGYKTIYSWVR